SDHIPHLVAIEAMTEKPFEPPWPESPQCEIEQRRVTLAQVLSLPVRVKGCRAHQTDVRALFHEIKRPCDRIGLQKYVGIQYKMIVRHRFPDRDVVALPVTIVSVLGQHLPNRNNRTGQL